MMEVKLGTMHHPVIYSSKVFEVQFIPLDGKKTLSLDLKLLLTSNCIATPPIEKKNELSKPYFYVLYMQGSTLHFHPNTILASACRIRYLCMYLTSLLQYRVS